MVPLPIIFLRSCYISNTWMFPKFVGEIPPNHPILIRVFHYFHYKPSILGVFPLFLETSTCCNGARCFAFSGHFAQSLVHCHCNMAGNVRTWRWGFGPGACVGYSRCSENIQVISVFFEWFAVVTVVVFTLSISRD